MLRTTLLAQLSSLPSTLPPYRKVVGIAWFCHIKHISEQFFICKVLVVICIWILLFSCIIIILTCPRFASYFTRKKLIHHPHQYHTNVSISRATVVKDRTTFWVGVESPPVIDLQSSDTLTCDKLTEESKLLSKKSQTNSTKSLSDKHLLKGDNGSVLLKRSEINKGNSSTRSVVLSIMRTISLLSVITLSHFFFF